MDREKVMSWLEGLSEPDWRDFHSDSEVQNIAKSALALLKEQEKPNGKCVNECECWDSAYERGKQDALKEQEEQKRKWLQTIADTQLAISPTGYESEDELAKRGWEWNGLQMAWEIIAGEERSEHPRLVRCKNCKHYDKTDCSDGFGWCNRNGEGCGRTDDWFCADGERKEGE